MSRKIRVTRREFLRSSGFAAGSVAIANILAACAEKATPTPAPPTAAAAPSATPVPKPTATTAPAPAAKQELRIATYDMVWLGMFPAGWASAERTIVGNVWLPPFIHDKDNNLLPGFLTRHEGNKEGTEWTLKVDPRAKWSDGSKMTAADIKAGWEASNAPVPEGIKLSKFFPAMDVTMGTIAGAKEHREGTASEIVGLQVVDDETLKVSMATPDQMFPQKLGHVSLGVMNAKQWAADPFIYEKPECLFNGPYKITKYDADAGEYVIEANENWWGDPVNVKRLEYRTSVDEPTMYAMWQNNEIDAAEFSGPTLRQLYDSPDKDLVVYIPTPGIAWGLFFNMTMEPTDDINLRKAMCHGTDINGIVEKIYGGTQKPALGWLSQPEVPCYKDRKATYEYNVDLAKEYLSKSRYGTGENVPKMQLVLWWEEEMPQMEAIIEQWRTNLGLRVEMTKDLGAVVREPERLYNICPLSIGAMLPDPVVFLKSMLPKWQDMHWGQSGHYENAEVTSALLEAEALPPDDPKRCELVLKAEQLTLDDYWGFGITRGLGRHFVKPWVKGWLTNIEASVYTLPKITVEAH